MRTKQDRIFGATLAATLGAALVGAVATPGCSGKVEGAGGDGGTSDTGSPAQHDSGPAPTFDSGPSFDSGPGIHDSGPAPTGDNCVTPGVTCITPPPPPGGGVATPGPHQYAMRKLYLGDTDRTGVASATAWKAYGYNLDSLVTTNTSVDVCTLAAGASKETQVDGNGGIDNSFGENILPIVITTAGSDFSATTDAAIEAGGPTDLVYVVGFDDASGNAMNATGLTGVFFVGASYAAAHGGAAPSWDVTTHWPIAPQSMNGCTATGGCPSGTNPVADAVVQFPHAYQSAGTFVTGDPADIPLTLGIGGDALPLLIRGGILTFQPKTPGSVTNGVIAGALATTDLVNALQAVAGSISTSLCSGSAFQSIAQQIEQASDIVLEGDQVTNGAGISCNAISIGVGFDATEVAPPVPGDIAGGSPAAPDPCGD
ncbi:MAG TPA: hypothetical protein VGG39_22945 [Polyangiaceae bacterium]|jgi:hypothetical protein